MVKKIEVVIMVGVPGSGKSTLSKQIAKDINAKIIESDSIRADMIRRGVWLLKDDWKVFKKMDRVANESVKKGINIIFDSTNTTEIQFRKKIGKAKSIDRANVTVVFVATPEKTCQERNISREAIVPEESMVRFFETFSVFPKVNGITYKYFDYTTQFKSFKVLPEIPLKAFSASTYNQLIDYIYEKEEK